jgi:hypothetical protein
MPDPPPASSFDEHLVLAANELIDPARRHADAVFVRFGLFG